MQTERLLVIRLVLLSVMAANTLAVVAWNGSHWHRNYQGRAEAMDLQGPWVKTLGPLQLVTRCWVWIDWTTPDYSWDGKTVKNNPTFSPTRDTCVAWREPGFK